MTFVIFLIEEQQVNEKEKLIIAAGEKAMTDALEDFYKHVTHKQKQQNPLKAIANFLKNMIYSVFYKSCI